MIDSIIAPIGFSALLVLSIIAYVFIAGTVLPRWFLSAEFCGGAARDRGLKKYTFPGGRAVTYEPYPALRDYVKRYVLFVKDGAKYIRCSLAREVSFIVYDIAVFDHVGKMIDVIRVNERIESVGVSRSVKLPGNTSYVSLSLRRVNGKLCSGESDFSFSKKNLLRFRLVSLLLTALEALAVRAALIELIGSFITEKKIYDIGVIPTLIVAIIVGLIFVKTAIRKCRKGGAGG